jgi:hypothetical protein
MRGLQELSAKTEDRQVGSCEMGRIMNPGSVLLGLDLLLKLVGDALELGDHAFDLRNLSPLLVDLKLFQANERIA